MAQNLPKAITMKDERFEKIPVDLIDPDPLNANIHSDENITMLGNLMDETSQLHPVYVTPKEDGRYRLITGEGRWKARVAQGKQYVEGYVITDLSAREITLMRVAENYGRNYDLVAQALDFAALIKHGYTFAELGRMFGENEKRINILASWGFYPPDLMAKMDPNFWGLMMIEELHRLRVNLNGHLLPPSGGWLTEPDQINYELVEQTIDLVNDAEIGSFQELRRWKELKRDEVQERQTRELEAERLQKRQEEIREEVDAALKPRSETPSSRMVAAPSRYSSKLAKARQLYQELASLEVQLESANTDHESVSAQIEQIKDQLDMFFDQDLWELVKKNPKAKANADDD